MHNDMTKYPIPPSGHPRLYLTADRLPGIKQALSAEQNRGAYAHYLACLGEEIDGRLPPPAPNMARRTNADSHLLGVIECLSLSWLLDQNREHARRAIDAILAYHETIEHYDYNTEGQEVFTLALVYDWCFDALTDEEKERFNLAIRETASLLELGYPEIKQGMVTGHGPEGQLMRDVMSAAIALYDEHPDLYDYAARPFFDHIIEPKKLFYASGAYPQGIHYLVYRMQWEFLATEIWNAIGEEKVFGDEQTAPLYWYLYMRRPDGAVFDDGDENERNSPLGEYWSASARSYFHGANIFSDPYLKREYLRQSHLRRHYREHGNQSLNAVEHLVFNDPDLGGRPRSELPLSRYFGGMRGEMIARTGWQDGSEAPVALVQMKFNTLHTANHQHLDAGAFQIWYKGYLATDSGYYQASREGDSRDSISGNTVYGSMHFFNYYRRTVAHNCMLVYDPNEVFVDSPNRLIVNDGGQRFPNKYNEARYLEVLTDPKNGYKMSEVLAHGFGSDPIAPDYTYLKGDLSMAYSEKVEAYTRSFMFLNLKNREHPALLFVYDRIRTSDPSFRKKWLLHTLEEPKATEYGYLASDTREYRGGQLAASILLPAREDRYVAVIGGEGRQHEVGGINFLGRRLEGNRVNEGDGYRIELSPKKGKQDDTFLVVLEPSDGGMTPLSATEIRCETHDGALVGDRIVLFGRGEKKCESLSFLSPCGEKARAYVADLASGLWQTPSGLCLVSEESGVAEFDAEPGENFLTKLFSVTKTPVQSTPEPVPSCDSAFTIAYVREGRGTELVYTPSSLLCDGVCYADVSALLPRLGYSAERIGDTLVCKNGEREIRLPIRGDGAVSLPGLAAAVGKRGEYDALAKLYYVI